MTQRILFIGPHRPNRNGSQRFRMEQYFPYLKEAGFDYDYSWFIDEKDDRVFYSSGKWIGKLGVFLKAIRIRLSDVLRSNRYDVIFIQREAFMTGSVFFEKQFSRSRARVIFDFDDAIWLDDVSEQNRKLRWLKRPSKTADIIRMADEVIAGNHFLAEYARQFSQHVHIIPTIVDTAVFKPAGPARRAGEPICIGWSGSKTTVKHFETVLPALRKLNEIYGHKIRFKLVGDRNFRAEGLHMECSDFSFENELKEFREMDIGLMPLPDDIWSKGKCAFKAIQYMSFETPPVVSPVGMNTEVVQHGVNGYLANSFEDWISSISQLVESDELRTRLGKKARQTILDKYSLQSQLDRFLHILST
ncbi:MAG: glycosyltransferase family 4 protein [Bacteroidetes bacterium]|nr:glycosyltransferase family 4 protein [Bacteroidota bacterium]